MAAQVRAAPVDLADNPAAWPDVELLRFEGVEDRALQAAAEAAALFVDVVVGELLARGWRTQWGAPSASALAQASGVSDATVSRVLRGKVWPDLATMARLAGAIDLVMAWQRTSPPPPEPERVDPPAPGQATRLVPASTADPARGREPSPPRRPPRRPEPRFERPYRGLNNRQRHLVARVRDLGLSWEDAYLHSSQHGFTLDEAEDLEAIDEARSKNPDLKRLLPD